MALKGIMARVERGIETMGEAPAPVLPAAPAARTVSPSTSVDASSTFEGRLRCTQTLRIDGCVEGEVECEHTVLVGEPARILASITADEVRVAGSVQGNITARRKITLERSAVVKGDLTTPGIVIEEGAKLKGRIVIGSDVEPAATAATAEGGTKARASKQAASVDPQSGEEAASRRIAASA